jgi:hypothetical protein
MYNQIMKKIPFFLILALLLSSCDLWKIAPQPFPVQSPVPTFTPAIITATPFIIPPPGLDFSPTPIGIITLPPSPLPSTVTAEPPTQTATQPIVQAVAVDILGCNTSIDISHGMGEVTNAYVTIKNTGNVDLPNACALLRAIDEDREHPDKEVCVTNLPAQYQVTQKLTVDSQYQADTIIQVDVTSNGTILLRVDKQSCRDISLIGGAPTDTGVVKPLQ